MFASESLDSLISWHVCAFVGFLHLLVQVKDKASPHVWVFRFRTASFHIIPTIFRHGLQHLELHFCSSLHISEGAPSFPQRSWTMALKVIRRRRLETQNNGSWKTTTHGFVRFVCFVWLYRQCTAATEDSIDAAKTKAAAAEEHRVEACGALDLWKALSGRKSINSVLNSHFFVFVETLRETGFVRTVQPLESWRSTFKLKSWKTKPGGQRTCRWILNRWFVWM